MDVLNDPETKVKPSMKIKLTNGFYAIIDTSDYEKVYRHHWYAKLFHCTFYAAADIVVKGHKKTLRMHRLIAGTPPGKVCHHLNHNGLDNRRCNLQNLTSEEHTGFHSNDTVRIKFAK